MTFSGYLFFPNPAGVTFQCGRDFVGRGESGCLVINNTNQSEKHVLTVIILSGTRCFEKPQGLLKKGERKGNWLIVNVLQTV